MSYSSQSFSVGQVLTAAQMTQVEDNIKDHVHGVTAGISAPAANAGRVVRTAGDITTTSTSLVDVTGATVTLTTGANPVLAGCAMSQSNATATARNDFNIIVDAALELGAKGIGMIDVAGGTRANGSFAQQTAALTAASHTIKMQWEVSAGTGSIHADSNWSFSYWAHEVH